MSERMQELNVYVVIRSVNGRYLLLRRVGTDLWEFPGGGVEWGENPEYTAIRETEEEVGLKVRIEKLLTITSATFKKSYGKKHYEKHAVYVVYYAVIKNEDNVYLSEEHEDFKWVEKNKFKDFNLCLNAKPVVGFLG